METCSNNFCLDSEWQATCLGLLMNLRNALPSTLENSMKIYPQVPKPLTKGAVYMIYVIFIFVLLAVAGSAITIYEFLLDSCARKTKSHENYTGISRKSSKNVLKKFPESSVARLNGLKPFLSCFCVLKNGRRLLSTDSNKDQFECIHGIRFLNNFWIILLHICMGYMSSVRNVEELKPLMGMWSSQLVLNGQYAVDAFFVLG
ncbi:hypothetical protein AVEN_113690-1 [Araneus ventricosus]|uniref:Uncharacterized protein n=1 Tax=Araneus ventricosus TaxID=182803 RepID=A0A4Y2R0Q8_ARAVE|nr:hypothetical protein AVEN_113690-1 [Araneus ventricosus]